MADKPLFYASAGAFVFDDDLVGWYDDARPLRGARTSQIYLDEPPVDDLEVVRLGDLKTVAVLSMFLLMGA